MYDGARKSIRQLEPGNRKPEAGPALWADGVVRESYSATRSLRLVTASFALSHLASGKDGSIHNYREASVK
jgi:hypothetical protein